MVIRLSPNHVLTLPHEYNLVYYSREFNKAFILMKKTYSYLIAGIVVICIIFFTIFNYTSPTSPASPSSKEPITIGAIISLSGAAASYGEYAKDGMQLAVSEINAKGGVNGRDVKLIIEDDKTDGKDAVSAFKKLTSIDKVQGVVGGLWDFVTLPLLPLAEENKIALISPSNFRIQGSFEPGSQSFVMLTEFEKTLQKAGEFLKRDDVKRVADIHFKSAFGVELSRSFNKMVVADGKGPMIEESYGQIGNNDFKTLVVKLKQENVDTVFLDMVDVDTVNFLKRSKEFGFTPKFMTYVGSYDAFKDNEKGLLEGITVLDWEFSKPAFNSAFKSAYGMDSGKSAQRAYDAVYILARSIAETNNTADVAGYTGSHTFETINGTVSFTPNHAVNTTDVKLETYRGGRLVPLESK